GGGVPAGAPAGGGGGGLPGGWPTSGPALWSGTPWGPRQPEHGRDGVLPRGRLRAVAEYIEEHLDAGPSLDQMAAVARLSAYHFARQFKRATGLPPHQYLIMRRVERAKPLLQGGDFSLAEVAAHAGFSGQSVFCHHFKRLLGVTPRQFRMSARNA